MDKTKERNLNFIGAIIEKCLICYLFFISTMKKIALMHMTGQLLFGNCLTFKYYTAASHDRWVYFRANI